MPHYVVLEHDLDSGDVAVLAVTDTQASAETVASERPAEWAREQTQLEYDLVDCGALQPEEVDPPTPDWYSAYYRVEVVCA